MSQQQHPPTEPDTPTPRGRLVRWHPIIVVGLLVLLFVQSAVSAWRNSVTVDEFAHLPAGYIYWARGNFFVYDRNPPLIKLWAALPLLRSGLDKHFVKHDNLWAAGHDFMMRNADKYRVLYWRCRVMIALLSVGLGFLVFRWSRELFGIAAGLLSLAAYVLSPNVINHSSIVSTDLGAAATYTLACYALYKLSNKWTIGRVVFVAVAVGLAIVTKFTGLMLLLLVPIVLVLDALFRQRDADTEPTPWRQQLVRGLITLAAVVVASVVIINASYAFRDTFKPWQTYEDEYGPVGVVGKSFLAPLAAPFPEPFLKGFSEQRWASLRPQFQYLCGQVSDHGWWYYYIVAFVFKVPIATMALLVLAAYAAARRFDRRAFVFVIVPALFFFLLFSFGTRVNMGIRYMLPVLTLLFVSFGAILRPDAPPVLKKPASLVVIAALVAWLAVEAAITCPQYLAYFNEFAGGHGERYVIDSNCDCSQDHIRLKHYLDEHGIERPYLATFGRVDAIVYGVQYRTLKPNERVTGDVFVSINLYYGYPYATPNNGDGWLDLRRKEWRDGYAWLHDYRPVGKVGGSLYHFRIEPDADADQD